MTELKKCIGIVSYFPEENNMQARIKRITRFTQLINHINKLWPQLDILIIAQNWKDYKLPIIRNNIIKFDFENGLGILNARRLLRHKFLELNYDYIIMLDDDAIINDCSQEIADKYLEEIDKHPNMFCFIHSKIHWHTCDDYAMAPLNLCAISRFIYEKEDLPQVELEKQEALEDDIFAVLLHLKYPEYEFLPPEGIYQMHNIKGQYIKQYSDRTIVPSTWYDIKNKKCNNVFLNTELVIRYLIKYKELPNFEELKKSLIWKR